MGKVKLVLLTIFKVLLLIAIMSCSKERIKEKQQLNTYEPINNYFDTKKEPEQIFVVDTNGTGAIVGTHGTRIYADKSKLMFPNGNDVHYPFEVRLIELYSPKEMVYYQVSNQKYDTILSTHCVIKLTATKNNQQLQLKPNCTWYIEIPASNPSNNMKCFYSISTSLNNWVDINSNYFITTSTGYAGEIKQLGWFSCAKIPDNYNTFSLVNTSFTSTTDDLSNVPIFMYFPNFKSLVTANLGFPKTPKNQNIKSFAIGINNLSELFYFYKEFQATQNTTINIQMIQTTDNYITNLLNNL
ncbi:MAG: hypothetical protein N3A01_02735 [Bacteroidales bacterium]|nr:hypothetical protein [Bacteroidales bacterium]